MRKRILLLTFLATFAAGVGILVWTATRTVYRMPSASMLPTIPVGARLVVDTAAYANRAPRPGDIVVFHAPFEENETFVKRVIAIGPAEVDLLADGTLLVDQEPMPRANLEGHTWEERLGSRRFRTLWDPTDTGGAYPPGPWPVFDGKIFLLGDNRQSSHDSRYWGPVDRSAIIGKVTHVDSGGADRAVN